MTKTNLAQPWSRQLLYFIWLSARCELHRTLAGRRSRNSCTPPAPQSSSRTTWPGFGRELPRSQPRRTATSRRSCRCIHCRRGALSCCHRRTRQLASNVHFMHFAPTAAHSLSIVFHLQARRQLALSIAPSTSRGPATLTRPPEQCCLAPRSSTDRTPRRPSRTARAWPLAACRR